ncbi:hypothetical protein ACOME3_006992 [Neoechinorhynchus agilis]
MQTFDDHPRSASKYEFISNGNSTEDLDRKVRADTAPAYLSEASKRPDKFESESRHLINRYAHHLAKIIVDDAMKQSSRDKPKSTRVPLLPRRSTKTHKAPEAPPIEGPQTIKSRRFTQILGRAKQSIVGKLPTNNQIRTGETNNDPPALIQESVKENLADL